MQFLSQTPSSFHGEPAACLAVSVSFVEPGDCERSEESLGSSEHAGKQGMSSADLFGNKWAKESDLACVNSLPFITMLVNSEKFSPGSI